MAAVLVADHSLLVVDYPCAVLNDVFVLLEIAQQKVGIASHD